MSRRRLCAAAVVAFAALCAVAFVVFAWLCYPEIPEEGEDSVQMQYRSAPGEAKGFGLDSARVDSQITFQIPAGQADAVYEYLVQTYVGKQGLFAAEFPGHSITGKTMSDVSQFTDSYFDTPDLALYRNKNSARKRTRLNTTHPEDRKSGRELVQMKVTPPGQFTLRNELKYKVEPSDKLEKIDDLHPLIRLIAKEQRQDFKRVYTEAGVNPYALQHVFTIRQQRRRGYIDLDGRPVFSFSVDEGAAGIWWARGSFASVDFGLVEVDYTEAPPEMRELMWSVRDAAVRDFVAKFPGVRQNNRSKYQIVLEQLMEQLPIVPALIRLGAVSRSP